MIKDEQFKAYPKKTCNSIKTLGDFFTNAIHPDHLLCHAVHNKVEYLEPRYGSFPIHHLVKKEPLLHSV